MLRMLWTVARSGWCVGLLLFAQPGCFVGPSEQRLGCLNGCAREKDQCILNAMTSQGIAACDAQARDCSRPCPQ